MTPQIAPRIADWDDAYANAAHIPGGEGFAERWSNAARDFRAAHVPEKLSRAELYRPAGPPRGLAVIIHGGYWMKFGPRWFSHLAAGPLARGWAVLLPAYTLAPAGRLALMRDEIAVELSTAAARIPGPIVLSGHSAGGHLAARLVCDDTPLPPEIIWRVTRCVPISGLFDLRPLQRTSYRDPLGLDDRTAGLESPLFHQPHPDLDLHLWVGADERPEFLRQTRLIHAAWAGIPRETRLTVEAGRHHMEVIAGLTEADHPLCEALLGGV